MKYNTKRLKLIKFLEDYESRLPFLDLIYLLKDHRKPGHLLDSAKDYFYLKNRYGFLRHKPPVTGKRRVLIVSLTSFIYQVKLEAMIAKALVAAGCEISVLTWRHFYWPKKYFRLFGIDNFIFLEDYFSKFNDFDLKNGMEEFLKPRISFQEVKKWEFCGCRIGQQVLSTIARRLFGTPDLMEPQIRALFNHFLKKQLKAIFAARNLLEETKPDILILNETNDSIYGAIFDLAFNKGLEAIQFVQPLKEDSLIFKRFTAKSKGLHPNSLSRTTFEKIRDLPWTQKHEEALKKEFEQRYSGKWFLAQRNQQGKVNKERDTVFSQLGMDKNKKVASVFSHVLWDANLFYGEDLFEDYEEWFIETVKAACHNPGVNWLIKLHPANIWKRNRESISGRLREDIIIEEKIGKLPKHIFLLNPGTDINTVSLFDLVDYGITVRGTVGMELSCFGKPVFTAGTGRYSGLGFTIDSSSKVEYLDKLSRIETFQPLSEEETLLAKKHAYAVFLLRCWKMRSFAAKFNYQKTGIHPLDHNLLPELNSYAQLLEADDLKKLSEWVLNSNEEDYLEDWSSAL